MRQPDVKKLITALLVAIFLTGALVVVFAQQPAGTGNSDDSSCYENCYLGCFGAAVKLSDVQKALIQEHIALHRENTTAIREQLTKLCQQRRSHESADEINEAAVRGASQIRANLQVELEVAHARLMSQLTNLLTPEQKAARVEQQRQREQRIASGARAGGKGRLGVPCACR